MQRLQREFEPEATGNAAQAAHPQCVANYIWINVEPFEPAHNDNTPMCGIPLHYVDRTIKNARKYPDAQFQIWLDSRYVQNSPTVFFLQSHIHASEVDNIRVRDLNEIEAYRDNPFFAPESEQKMWHRADLARLLVVRNGMDENPGAVSLYSDFDVRDIRIESSRFRKAIASYGQAIGTAVPINHRHPENGYFAFDDSEKSKNFLDNIIRQSYRALEKEKTYSRSTVYYAYYEAISGQRMTYCNLFETLMNVLEPCDHQIRKNKDYYGISIT